MVGRVNIILILIVLLSISVTVENSSVTTISQSQEDWSPNNGEKLKCMRTITWNQYSTTSSSKTTVNGWPELSVETYPPLDVLETWSDIPQLNETFTKGGEVCTSLFNLVYLHYDYWQGQGQHWFHCILPNRSSSFYESLIATLTQGPWNCSIDPEFSEDDTAADSDPIYWGYHYSFDYDGYFYNVTATYWISAGYDVNDNYTGVLRDGWVKMYNETTGNEIHMRRIRCSPSGPTIGGQNFYHSGEKVGLGDTGEYTEGETDNRIVWTPLFWPKDFGSSVNLYLNDTRIVPERFTWTNHDSITYNYSVDGLDPGFYNFTFSIKDITGNIDTSTFLLTVQPSDTFENTMLLSGIGILAFICVGLVIYFKRKNRILD